MFAASEGQQAEEFVPGMVRLARQSWHVGRHEDLGEGIVGLGIHQSGRDDGRVGPDEDADGLHSLLAPRAKV
jgi:hypothetical protein